MGSYKELPPHAESAAPNYADQLLFAPQKIVLGELEVYRDVDRRYSISLRGIRNQTSESHN
jgi:hypothetical protein